MTILGDESHARVPDLRRAPGCEVSPSRRIRPASRGRRPMTTSGEVALPVALDAGHADDLPARTSSEQVPQATAGEALEPQDGLADLDLRLLEAEQARDVRPSSRRASPSTSPPAWSPRRRLPRRSTVIRSAISSTSSSLWLMKTIDFPSARRRRRFSNRSPRLRRGEHRGRLVQDQDLDAAVERLQDLDALLLADGEVLDRRVRIDLEPVRVGELLTCCSDSSGWRIAPPSSPRITFSATVNGSTSTKCWWTIPIPARSHRAGVDPTSSPSDHDPPRIRRIHAVEDPHQGGLARPRSLRSAHAPRRGGAPGRRRRSRRPREALRDALEHDEGRGAPAPRPVAVAHRRRSSPMPVTASPEPRSSPLMMSCLVLLELVDDVLRHQLRCWTWSSPTPSCARSKTCGPTA